MRLEFTGVNTNKLHDELIAAGITPRLVESLDDKTWITVEENQVDEVNDVVAIHDPTPLPPPLTEIEQLRLEQSLANVELFEMMLLLTGGGLNV